MKKQKKSQFQKSLYKFRLNFAGKKDKIYEIELKV